jgi:hypothetical protein
MISSLELCQIVESALLPSRCQCSVDARGLMTIQLYNCGAGYPDFLVRDVPVSTLSTSRSIASLITGLNEELRLRSAHGGLMPGSVPAPSSSVRGV